MDNFCLVETSRFKELSQVFLIILKLGPMVGVSKFTAKTKGAKNVVLLKDVIIFDTRF